MVLGIRAAGLLRQSPRRTNSSRGLYAHPDPLIAAMVRLGIEVDAGPQGEVNLAANVLDFDCFKSGRPSSPKGT
jgi:hypothetical protein